MDICKIFEEETAKHGGNIYVAWISPDAEARAKARWCERLAEDSQRTLYERLFDAIPNLDIVGVFPAYIATSDTKMRFMKKSDKHWLKNKFGIVFMSASSKKNTRDQALQLNPRSAIPLLICDTRMVEHVVSTEAKLAKCYIVWNGPLKSDAENSVTVYMPDGKGGFAKQ